MTSSEIIQAAVTFGVYFNSADAEAFARRIPQAITSAIADIPVERLAELLERELRGRFATNGAARGLGNLALLRLILRGELPKWDAPIPSWMHSMAREFEWNCCNLELWRHVQQLPATDLLRLYCIERQIDAPEVRADFRRGDFSGAIGPFVDLAHEADEYVLTGHREPMLTIWDFQRAVENVLARSAYSPWNFADNSAWHEVISLCYAAVATLDQARQLDIAIGRVILASENEAEVDALWRRHLLLCREAEVPGGSDADSKLSLAGKKDAILRCQREWR